MIASLPKFAPKTRIPRPPVRLFPVVLQSREGEPRGDLVVAARMSQRDGLPPAVLRPIDRNVRERPQECEVAAAQQNRAERSFGGNESSKVPRRVETRRELQDRSGARRSGSRTRARNATLLSVSGFCPVTS